MTSFFNQMLTIETVAGDSAPDITFPITREDEGVVDLTGCTVRLKIKNPRTGLRTNDANNLCTVIDAVNGVVVYSWNVAGTDCPDPGVYKGFLVITYPTTKKETYLLRINAKPNDEDE